MLTSIIKMRQNLIIVINKIYSYIINSSLLKCFMRFLHFRYALDAFLNELPNCINRELIDNAAVDFVLNLNTKNNRKKLTRVLFSVARTRLDLLPFYSRFASILYPVLPDVCVDLCQMLKQDFKYHVRKKDQINIESKVFKI